MNTTANNPNKGLELTALKVGRLAPVQSEQRASAGNASGTSASDAGAVQEEWTLQLNHIPKDVTADELTASICALNIAKEYSEACRQLMERQSTSIDSISKSLTKMVTTAYIAISNGDQDTAKEKSQLIRILGHKI